MFIKSKINLILVFNYLMNLQIHTCFYKKVVMQKYNKIDQHIHQLSQTLAKFGRSFAEKKIDDSHTNLYFDLIGKTIWGRWTRLNNGEYILGLDLDMQQFKLLNKNHEIVKKFDIRNTTQANIEQQIITFLNKRLSEDKGDFLKPLHFKITEYSFFNESIQPFDDEEIMLWMQYRHLANEVCILMLNYLKTEAEVRIWPHHFDTGIYFEASSKTAISFGWAMADLMVPDAYFYFSVYGLNNHQVDYNSVNTLSTGKWMITKNWKGAVLTLQDSKLDNCLTFIKETTQWAFSL